MASEIALGPKHALLINTHLKIDKSTLPLVRYNLNKGNILSRHDVLERI